jgi:hypothetical protein
MTFFTVFVCCRVAADNLKNLYCLVQPSQAFPHSRLMYECLVQLAERSLRISSVGHIHYTSLHYSKVT